MQRIGRTACRLAHRFAVGVREDTGHVDDVCGEQDHEPEDDDTRARSRYLVLRGRGHADPRGSFRRHPAMVLFLTLLIAGIALILIGAAVDGMLYLLPVGVLLLIADLLYLAARSMWRSPRRTAR